MGLISNYSGLTLECGTDEAGRGCLAGPVTAAAVILPKGYENDDLNDSKQLSSAQRIRFASVIKKEALCFSVSHVSPQEIDNINILNASLLAMRRAIKKLNSVPEFIIVDGIHFKPFERIPHETLIKGDSKYLSIAAASILAKTCRDLLMERLHEEFPVYNWKQNKGYPTKEHKKAIVNYGLSKYHRMSFKSVWVWLFETSILAWTHFFIQSIHHF